MGLNEEGRRHQAPLCRSLSPFSGARDAGGKAVRWRILVHVDSEQLTSPRRAPGGDGRLSCPLAVLSQSP